MEQSKSAVKLADHFLVGSAASGHDFVQNMYGMYIRFEQNIESNIPNLIISNDAYKAKYKPLVSTSIGHQPVGDTVNADILKQGQEAGHCEPEQLMRITRDYKDVLVSLWKTHTPHIRWKEFKEGPLGFPLIAAFEEDAAKFEYSVVISYEELVKSPQQVLTSVIHHLLPVEGNEELESFGTVRRDISLSAVDRVVEESQVRTLREGNVAGMLDSVGIHKQYLTEDNISEVEEFVANL